MTTRSAARRYARALFDVALAERVDLGQLEHELAGVVDLFRQHPALERVLLNPAVPAPRKRAAVGELVARSRPLPVLGKLLLLLAERDRLILLPDLLAFYRDRLLEHRNVVRAEVTTALPLAPDRAAGIEQRLTEATGRSVLLQTRVDPAIVGGMVARVGGVVYDGSVTMQLEKMKQRLAASV